MAVTRLLPRRSWPALVAGAALILGLAPIGAAADSAPSDASAQVDTLWNQPQGTRPDSAFYVIELWWDGLTRAGEHDRTQRGLRELAQANSDLLNAYALLQEQRDDPGPHPVPGVDPLLSGVYGIITGIHVKAPIGSVFSWVNESVVRLEGRGTTDTIVRSLLRDYQTERSAASRDLGSAVTAENSIWAANATRQMAMLNKIADVAPSSLGLTALLATGPAGSSQGTGNANGNANANGNGKDKANAHGQSGDPHGKATGKKP